VAEPSASTHDDRPLGSRAFKAAVAIALLIVLAYLAAAFLPRWWAHRIGHQANGSLSLGIVLGLFYGFVFTMLPLATARFAFRKRRPWKTWALLAALAVLLEGPNLLTLGIVIGSGHAAHAGERTLDVDAPGFRGATLAGVLAAVAGLLLVEYLLHTRRRSERLLQQTREQLGTKDPGAAGPTPTEGSG